MMPLAILTVRQAAAALGLPAPATDVAFTGVSTDTRSIAPGNLFVALQGPNFDAHDFIVQAEAKGAAAVMLQRPVTTRLPTLLVDDTRLALGRLGAARRAAFDIPVVGVTGSNGKTTVKEMTGAILGRRGDVLITQGNLNNDIGMPQTLLRLGLCHRYAVIEMGANHPGEIAYLTALARPTVAVINNAGPAHLEGFGSIEGVARAKGEIYQGLSAGGVAVINAEDAHAHIWEALNTARRVLRFGISATAEVRAVAIQEGPDGSSFRLLAPAGEVDVRIVLPGRHNILNALAASACALAAGASLHDVSEGLAHLDPVKGRLRSRRGKGGARVIDDTYNANPASLAAAIAVLAAAPGRRILVIGDMRELGPEGVALHRQAGEAARVAGIDRLYATGELSRAAIAAFGLAGQHFSDHAALTQALMPELGADTTILVKGSRSMHMERVVEALI